MIDPFYSDPLVTLYLGDCLDVMRELPDASVDSVVTDPPYGLEFMGKSWDSFKATGNFGGGGIGDPAAFNAGSSDPKKRGNNSPLTGRPRFNITEPLAYQSWCTEWATEAFRVLKPGGYLLAFGGTRTYHRLASAIEDAGFEIRDTLMWIYASGFPKSLDVSKALDKVAGVNDETHRRIQLVAEVIRTHREAKGMERAEVSRAVVGTPSGACWNWEHNQLPSVEMWGRIKEVLDIPDKFDGLIQGIRAMFIAAEREVVGRRTYAGPAGNDQGFGVNGEGVDDPDRRILTAPATDLARKWEGWGTALKPAHEPIVMARKPLVGTVAQNVTRYGTGALNIDGSRINSTPRTTHKDGNHQGTHPAPMDWGESTGHTTDAASGRWPSNVILSSPELFDEPNPGVVGSGATVQGAVSNGSTGDAPGYEGGWRQRVEQKPGYGDSGGYSRFFLVPKASRAERERGLDTFPAVHRVNGNKWTDQDYRVTRGERPPSAESGPRRNVHPTVKPIDLMRHLVRLVTPPGGVVLDPFLGSGTTAIATSEEGFCCIGIEREAEYMEIAKGRIMATAAGMGL